MWKSSRKEDDLGLLTSEPITPAAHAVPATHATEPVGSDISRRADLATIGKSVIVKGELSGSEDLYVDGQVEGSIGLRGQTLTVGPNGRVRANVEARNLIVHGRVDGDVHATERVDLRKTASLSGDITTARISIEDGAFFKGTIDIQKSEPSARPETKPQSAVAAAPKPTVGPVTVQGSLLEPKKF